jgi:hypothetical protein
MKDILFYWVWSSEDKEMKYHAYESPKTGVDCTSLCGSYVTRGGGETKTPGGHDCKTCRVLSSFKLEDLLMEARGLAEEWKDYAENKSRRPKDVSWLK